MIPDAAAAGSRPANPGGSPSWTRSAPALVIAAYVFLLPVQLAGPADPTRIAPSDVLLLAYFVMRLPRMRHHDSPLYRWSLGLVAVIWFSIIVKVVRDGYAAEYVIRQKAVGIVVLLVSFICLNDFLRSWDRITWLLRIFLASAVLNAFLAVSAFLLLGLGGPQIPLVNAAYPTSRIAGLLVDPNAFGGVVAVALVLHLATAACNTTLLGRKLSWAASLILPLALLLTFSRSAWIGLGLGLVGIVLWRPRSGLRVLKMLGAYLLLIAPILALIVTVVLPDALALVFRPSKLDARADIADRAIEEIQTAPVFGMGLGAYLERYGVIVHNTVLWFLTETGVTGFAVFCGLAVTCVVLLRKADRAVTGAGQHAVILGLLSAHLVMLGLSVGIEALYQRHWWMILAMSSAAYVLGCRSTGIGDPPDDGAGPAVVRAPPGRG